MIPNHIQTILDHVEYNTYVMSCYPNRKALDTAIDADTEAITAYLSSLGKTAQEIEQISKKAKLFAYANFVNSVMRD